MAELEKLEKKQHGGKREGSGREKKEITVEKIKKQLKDYLTEDEIKEFVVELKIQAKTKPELLKFTLEQVFGKAAQQVEMNHTGKLEMDVDIKKMIDKVYG